MAAGYVQISILDGGGVSRNQTFWSSDGTITGNLSSTPVGPQLAAGSLSVSLATDAALPAGENHLGEVGGNSAVPSVTITRPANTTAYTSGQLVSFNTVAATVNATPTTIAVARKNAGTGVIRRVRLATNHTGLAGTEVFRVHLFKTAPTVVNGDGASFSANGVTAIAFGYIDVTLTEVFSDGSKGYTSSDIIFDAAGGSQSIFVLLEARNAYTPTSGEVLTITLECLRD